MRGHIWREDLHDLAKPIYIDRWRDIMPVVTVDYLERGLP